MIVGDESGTAFMPRGVVHTFKNVGDEPSRMLIMTTPSGIEKFFARCAEEFAKSAKPDMSRLIEIGAEHGIHFLQDWEAAVNARLGRATAISLPD